MREQISNSIFYTLGLYDIWNMLDNQQKETLTEAINIGIDEGLKANPVENRVMPKIAEEIYDDLIYDLTDRRGLKQEYWNIDDDVRLEIKHTWVEIIKKRLSNFTV